MTDILGYLILPAIVLVIVLVLHATDPSDVNIYVALYRKIRGN